MTDDPRADLLRDLELINRALERKGVPALVTVDEADSLPIDNLRSVVAGSGDHPHPRIAPAVRAVSWQAMHAVAVDGPADNALWRLLMVIADFAQEDGSRAVVGHRLLAKRAGVRNRRLPKLIAQAVEDGWLIVDNPGGSRHANTYSIANLYADRVRSVRAERSDRVRELSAVSAQSAYTDVRRSNVRRASATRDASLASGQTEPVDAYAHFPNWTAERFARENGNHE